MSTAPEANATLVTSDAPERKELALLVQKEQLDSTSAEATILTFEPFLKRAREWAAQVEAIKVTDASHTRQMKLAHDLRMALREVRVDSDKARKKLKENSLRFSKAIDGAHNIVKAIVEPLEEKLEAQEKFVEKQEADRKVKLKTAREALMSPYGIDTSFMDLGSMPQDSFDILLTTSKTQHEEKRAAALKAEADRVAKEKADADERARVKAENEKLRREAAEKETALATERKKAADAKTAADLKLKKEREASEAAAKKLKDEADAKARAEKEKADAALAEERRKGEEAAAETKRLKDAETARVAKEKADKDAEVARVAAVQKAASAAPDQKKVLAFAATVRSIPVPTFTSEAGKALGGKIAEQFSKMAAWLEAQAKTL